MALWRAGGATHSDIYPHFRFDIQYNVILHIARSCEWLTFKADSSLKNNGWLFHVLSCNDNYSINNLCVRLTTDALCCASGSLRKRTMPRKVDVIKRYSYGKRIAIVVCELCVKSHHIVLFHKYATFTRKNNELIWFADHDICSFYLGMVLVLRSQRQVCTKIQKIHRWSVMNAIWHNFNL